MIYKIHLFIFERPSPKKVYSQSIKLRYTTEITSQVTQLRHKTSKNNKKIWIICEKIKCFQYTFVGLLQTLKIIPNENHFSLPHKKSTDILNYHTKGS